MSEVVTEEVWSSMGGMFFRDLFDHYDSLEEAIIDDIEGGDTESLSIMKQFCETLLDPKMSNRQRRKYWVEAVTEEFMFTHEGLIEVLNFIKSEIDKELKRQKRDKF